MLLRAAFSLTAPPDTATAVGEDTGAYLPPPRHAGSTQPRAGWDMGATSLLLGSPAGVQGTSLRLMGYHAVVGYELSIPCGCILHVSTLSTKSDSHRGFTGRAIITWVHLH